MAKIKSVVWIPLLFLITSMLNILYNRQIWFDEAYSLEIARYPLSYFVWSDMFMGIVAFIDLIALFIIIYKVIKIRQWWISFVTLPMFGYLYYIFFNLAVPKDVHPPLSYVLLKFNNYLFGWSTYSSRGFVLLFGIIGVVFLYKIIEYIYGEKLAIYMMVSMAFLSSYLQYFTEVRMYSMYFCFSVMSFYFLVRYVNEGGVKWVWFYVFSLIPYPWIHWYMCYPFLMQLIYIFMFKREMFMRHFEKFLLPLILWLPAVLYFFKQVMRLEGMWLRAATFKSFFSTIHYFFFHSNTDLRGQIENYLGYFIVLFAFIAIYYYISNIENIHEKKYALYFLLYALLPPVIGLVIQKFWNVYHHRYFVFMGWAFIVLLVRSVMIPKKEVWQKYFYKFFAVAMILIIGYQAFYYVNTTAFELRDMNNYVRDNYCNTEYSLLHESPFSSVPAAYYMRLYGCNNTNWIHSDLTDRLFRSAGGDVIPMELRLNGSESIEENIDYTLYWAHKNNLIDYDVYDTRVLLEYDGISLVEMRKKDVITHNDADAFDILVEVK